MNVIDSIHRRWLFIVLFAVAMAWMEAATVYYLRTLVDRIEPHQPLPLPDVPALGGAELVREAATLVMLFAVGWLAGGTWRNRLAVSAIAFGIWDIFYYVFLKIMTGWPKSLADWDILFLLPLPWWGPVWAPTSIALVMILWGIFVTGAEAGGAPARSCWRKDLTGLVGILVALFVFMEDAIRTVNQGTDALRAMLPEKFNSLLFSVALALMAVPVIDAGRMLWRNSGNAGGRFNTCKQ